MPLNHAHPFRTKHSCEAPNLSKLTTLVLSVALTLFAFAVFAGQSYAETAAQSGGAGYSDIPPTPATSPGARAVISSDGRSAVAPTDAPLEVQKAIWAANKITKKPYIYGGGHKTVKKLDRGYDCSGTLSWAIGQAGLMESPLDSSSFMKWGDAGKGDWITVYTNPGHAYAIIAGLRLDTSGPGEKGPRWRKAKRSAKGFRARHPEGF